MELKTATAPEATAAPTKARRSPRQTAVERVYREEKKQREAVLTPMLAAIIGVRAEVEHYGFGGAPFDSPELRQRMQAQADELAECIRRGGRGRPSHGNLLVAMPVRDDDTIPEG